MTPSSPRLTDGRFVGPGIVHILHDDQGAMWVKSVFLTVSPILGNAKIRVFIYRVVQTMKS
jgi:hypothetical protein